MSKLKILYLSAHEILEYDEVSIFHELGYNVFSPGAYVCNLNRGMEHLRPDIPGLIYDPEIVEKYHRIGQQFPGEDGKDHLSREVVDWADVIIVMHIPRWIINNSEVLKGKRVIWRTIGQSISARENELRPYRNQGMQIVRYSPMEERIPGYLGSDALVRFAKDPGEYGPWNGNVNRVISFVQSMRQREDACNFRFFEEVTRPFPRHLFGPGNEGLPWTTGKVTYDRLKKEMCDNRCFFYTGTHPASYTLAWMEAMMTGIPVVAVGPKIGNPSYFPGHELYEIPYLMTNGVDGFWSDDPGELRAAITELMNNYELAKKISAAGRQLAEKHFNRPMIMAAWKKFLEG